MAYSLLAKAQDITGWTDGEVAQIAGVSRQLVQKIRTGLTPEYLNARQIDGLLAAVRLYRDRVAQGYEELESFS